MARSQARVLTSIWHDKDFVARSGTAQRLYLLALSQDTVSFCGVVPYTARRWATLASDTSVPAVRRGIEELAAHHFILVDHATEELWIRSFVKYDGVLASPNLIRPMVRDFDAIHSQPIREAIRQYLADHFPDGLPDGFPKGIRELYAERFQEPIGYPPCAHSAGPLASCLLPPKALGFTETHDDDPQAVENRDLESENRTADPPTDPILERLDRLCQGHNRFRVKLEAVELRTWAQPHVDDRLLDEAIGIAEHLATPPDLPRAIVPIIQTRAARNGIHMPDFHPSDIGSRPLEPTGSLTTGPGRGSVSGGERPVNTDPAETTTP